MNPVFVFLVIIGAGILWLLSSFAFRLVGRIVDHLIGNAKRAMDDKPLTLIPKDKKRRKQK